MFTNQMLIINNNKSTDSLQRMVADNVLLPRSAFQWVINAMQKEISVYVPYIISKII